MRRIFQLTVLLLALPLQASVTMPNGDVNGDGVVNISDINVVIDVIISGHQGNMAADINGDGVVNISDVNATIQNILNPPPFIETFTVYGVSFQMVSVEGGTFTMGSKKVISGNYNPWSPPHEVTLSTYSIGKTEVTQELWTAVMGANPSRCTEVYPEPYDDNSNRPVECVSWDDCQEFLAKLNRLTGRKFRLPTEAEWEFAARGGNRSHGYEYAGGNSDSVCWNYANCGMGGYFPTYASHPVATKAPNELGLYDMSGNVEEWCQDYWLKGYSADPQTNPTGPDSGTNRVYRGGSWSGIDSWWPLRLNVWWRSPGDPSLRCNYLGLRLAL